MMNHSERFHMRLTPQDKQVFAELAAQLHRSESDAIRVIAREVLAALKAEVVTQAAGNHSPAEAER